MKRFTIPFAIAAMSTVASSQQFGGAVRFYFSTPGGDNTRISQDAVTSANWTAEYDIVFENVSGHDITFNGAFAMIGFGKSTDFGEIATPVTGTDTIRERFAFTGNQSFASNPNITWVAPWVSDFSARTRMYGGYAEPLSGPVRPWGLYATASNSAGFTKTIRAGEVLPFFRIALRDNGLFEGQGVNSVHLYNYPVFPFQASGSTSLRLTTTSTSFSFFDNQDYFENSKLVLAAPEPASSAVLALLTLFVALRKRGGARG
ncbi:MAG: hypothetical protein K1X67_07370 [Fimbriimonadaceae bacterium]|nr:hypothetical protein [Fimbriimonadaceae bacterium]